MVKSNNSKIIKTLEVWALMEEHYNLAWLITGKLSINKYLKNIINTEKKEIPKIRKSIMTLTDLANKYHSDEALRKFTEATRLNNLKQLETAELRLKRAKAFLNEKPNDEAVNQ